MTTYASEAYSAANGLSIMWTYTFSDGEKWTKLDEEYLATDMQMRRRTRVWVQDFEGDTERRSTLKALTAKTSAATMTSHTVIDGAKAMEDTEPADMGTVPAAPASRTEKREAALAAAEAEDTARVEAEGENAPEAAPAALSYEKTTVWGSHLAGIPNVYTYAFNDGVTYVQRETKEIVRGGFTTTVRRTSADGATAKSTLRELNQRIEQARTEAHAAAQAEGRAQRAADAPEPLPRPAYRIESGFEEQALPLTYRQEAVVLALHRELGLRYPLEVLPPVNGNDELTASGDEASGRFLMEIDAEGYVQRVAVRYEVAGFVGWADLDTATSDLKARVLEVARAARRTTTN